jgi:hypothetical protein
MQPSGDEATLLLSGFAESVVSETISDESIVINVLTGHYHRLIGVASQLWQRLQAGINFEEWQRAAQQLDRQIDRSALASFALRLAALDLIVIDPAAK